MDTMDCLAIDWLTMTSMKCLNIHYLLRQTLYIDWLLLLKYTNGQNRCLCTSQLCQ